MIEILITTYNRSDYLYLVLKSIRDSLMSKNCIEYKNLFKIRIHEEISNNTANKEEIKIILENFKYEYKLFKSKQGMIKGILSLFEEANSEYIMLHSDDDFLKEDYLFQVAKILNLKRKIPICIMAKNISRSNNKKDALRISKENSTYKVPKLKECKNFVDKTIFACRSHQLTGLVLPNEALKTYLKNSYIFDNYHPSLGATVTAIFKNNAKPFFLTNYSVIVSKENVKSWSYNKDFFFYDIQQHFSEIFGGFKSLIASAIIFSTFNDKYLLKPFTFFSYIYKKVNITKTILLAFIAIFLILKNFLRILFYKLSKMIKNLNY